MSTVAKIFVVLNLALAVAFLGAAATFLGYLDSFKKKYDDEVVSHRKTKDEAAAAAQLKQADLDKALARVNEMNTQLSTANTQATTIKNAYGVLVEAYAAMNTSLTKATSAIEIAQQTIKSGRDLADQLAKDRTALKDALTA